MRGLSNFRRDNEHAAAGVVCRPVADDEINLALRLILCTEAGLADAAMIDAFNVFAELRKIDLSQCWVAVVGSTIVWALLPIQSPGRTMLIFSPGRLTSKTPREAAVALTDAVCEHWQSRGTQLAQFLLDPRENDLVHLYLSADFKRLAELCYLQRSIRGDSNFSLPENLSVQHYSPAVHALYADTILRSYESSLDCPALNGERDVNDIIAGHQAAGVFDANQWYLLCEKEKSLGVLILSPIQDSVGVELVYLGLVPEARGRGLGDVMMQMAIDAVSRMHRSELTLAVDSINKPALNLYFRHGMKRVGSRVALMRTLSQH